MSYDGSDVKTWQRRLRKIVHRQLGMDRFDARRCPLNARSIWQRTTEHGCIEKIVLTTEAKVDVPAYVCLPHEAKPPYRFVICLQGHGLGMNTSIGLDLETESRPIAVPDDHDYANACLKRGLAAICIEQRSFGWRSEKVQKMVAPHGCHDAACHALLLGRTLVGERVFDVDRAIDYLATRHDVDMKHLGIMGHSGGGSATMYALGLLPRLGFGIVSCAFCTFSDSIMRIYHCVDNYVPGLLRYGEMADVMGLAAPKPLVIVNGQKDPIFPVDPAKKAFRHLQGIYRAAGAAKQVAMVVATQGGGGHRFYADQAWAAMFQKADFLARS